MRTVSSKTVCPVEGAGGLDMKIRKRFHNPQKILVFYMLHEVPNQQAVLHEFKTLLNPDGKILIVEPKIHVPKKDFAEMEKRIIDSGFQIEERPAIFFSRSVVLKNI
jgi:hypothetical protein